MKQVLATILLASIITFSFATEKEKVIKEKGLHHISCVELDMLIDLIEEVDHFHGAYTVEVFNNEGELVQKDWFQYEDQSNTNTIGYRSDYTIRMTLSGGVTHDFILKD